MVTRTEFHTSRPLYTSDAPIGVVTMAWNVRTHLVPAITGQSDSDAAVCMALAASKPGATNVR
jgi:hypothetical protein